MPLGPNGREERFVNGQKIVIKPKNPVEIQTKVNKASRKNPGDLKDLRSTFDPKDLEREIAHDFAEAFQKDSFSRYNKYADSDKERDKQRFYQVYRDMYTHTFIKNALDIVKNEACQRNDKGSYLNITSDNQDVVDDGNELFNDILDIDYELKDMVLDTCQMGDNYYEIVLDDYEKPKSIIHLEYISPERIQIMKHNGRIKFYVWHEGDLEYNKGRMSIDPWNFMGIDEKKSNIKVYMPWQIVHFKMKDRESDPYGRSLLRTGIRDYRRLALLEDTMLIYRISRAPERRIFYVDVGQLNAVDAKIFLNKIKNSFKKEPIIDESGNLSKRLNPMSLMEDYYIPVREGTQGTRIESLQGGQQLNEIRDVEYFKDKILRILNIPMPYMGGSPEQGTAEVNKSLSNIDLKFANYVEEIQSHITKGLNKILALQLILKKYKNDDIINFKIDLTPPSNLQELIKLDFMTQQAGVAGTYKGLQMFSDEWIYKKVFKFSNKEIYQEQVKLAAQMQKMQQTQQQMMPQGGDMGAPPMGGDMGAPAPGGEVAPPPEGAAPAPEVASYNPFIYELGLKMLAENYDEFAVQNFIQKLGEGYLVESKEDAIKFIAEVRALKKILKNEEEEKEKDKKKKRHKNSFQSMVRLGEFNGLDIKNRTLTFYRDQEEQLIDLNPESEGELL
jgi:hypothetical protein